MTPKEHIEKIESILHALNQEGHVKSGDEWVAMEELQNRLHDLKEVYKHNASQHLNDHGGSGNTAGEVSDNIDKSKGV